MTVKVGINLTGMEGGTSENPFLNMMKYGSGWTTRTASNPDTSEEAALYANFLDSNGYATTFGTGPGAHTWTQLALGFYVNQTLPSPYVAGTYVFLYDGAGTFEYHGDLGPAFNAGQSTAGRQIFNITTPSTGGLRIFQTGTTDGNYAKNFRFVYAPTATDVIIDPAETAITNNPLSFNPAFLNRIAPFKVLRFMDWMGTNGSTQTTWSNRPTAGWIFWGDQVKWPAGSGIVPLEVCFALCNATGADCWINIPVLADDNYATQAATLAASNLSSSAHVYVEFANEMMFTNNWPASWVASGYVNFPAAPNDFTAGNCQTYLRMVKTLNAAKAVLGSRCTRVLGGQFSNTGTNDFLLTFTASQYGGDPTAFSGTMAQNGDAFCVAPYVSFFAPIAWTSDNDGGLNKLFYEIFAGGTVPTGAGANTTTGTVTGGLCTAYALTSDASWGNGSLPSSPANQQMIQFKAHANSGTSPTLAVDGGTAFPIQYPFGNAAGALNSNYQLAAGTTYFACMTKNTSQGAVTPAWVIMPGNQNGSTGGVMAGYMVPNIIAATGDSNLNGIPVLAYEGGQTFVDYDFRNNYYSDPSLYNLYTAANRDLRMFNFYTILLNDWANHGGTVFNHFSDIGYWAETGFWSVLESMLTPAHSPKYDGLVQYINPHRRGMNMRGGF
jgi:hypothetical protein